ncbi:hypothetical protein P170DRAFT_54263 [Aspergillus steynii IBT 23096]|uniref:Zn(2)-C6 fungal-type domain-containing protein n=1 Tax=Aspergillus steynii IBT 23096 TaxID=1392250 RepID=A0A2I2FS86_9EURO|nr:uncharacterized protein P170DRAFT_54263 [Aspergillus steynii IBT 23096]PLB43498.1 hypothetical protein P170DRAFT_54263 [Aspergillus steynii IBT 23096]
MAITRVHKSQRTGVRASLACVQCRSQHAKCGAEMPACSRCRQDGKPCFYVQSRRSANAKARSPSLPVPDTSGDIIFPTPLASAHVFPIQDSDCLPIEYRALSAVSPMEAMNVSCPPESEHAACRRFLDAYYSNFHNAHPFLTSYRHFLDFNDTNAQSLICLLPVVHYIGSLYVNDGSSTWLKQAALKQLGTMDLPISSLPLDGYTTLAFLLMAIAAYGQDDRAQARLLLNRGMQMAIDVGMNRRSFASAEPDPVWAESWRRTYWGLYITDVIIAGLWHETNIGFCDKESDVDLPSDDVALEQPRTIEQYEIRDFEDKVPIFSSFTYLIDLVKIAHSVLHLSSHREDRNTAVTNADTMLFAWKLHLPVEKQSVVKEDGRVDHIMFHAHILWQSLVLTIHQPLSRFNRNYNANYEDNSLISPSSSSDDSLWEDQSERLHTRRTLDAVTATMNLCALPIPIVQQSPLTVNCVALSTMASMMEYQSMLSSSHPPTRDKVRLGIAILNQFAQVWAIGVNTSSRMKKMAREVFTMVRPDQLSEPGFAIDVAAFMDQNLLSAAEAWPDFHSVGS